MKQTIQPGQVWLDTKGERIQAHGGSVWYEDGFYYWYGEDKSHTRKKGKIWTWGIRCYRSRDLVNWEDMGYMIQPEPDQPDSIFHPNRRMDRPHILKNPHTGKYVLWLKYCDQAHFAVLTADAFLGPYTLHMPVYRPEGRKVGDFDLAADPATGEAYLYVELDHKDVVVYRLKEDYLEVDGQPNVIYTGLNPPFAREGVTHFCHGGKHYLLTSGMIGYVPNPSEVAVAEDYMGPFRVLGDPHVDDASSASFNSQASCAFRVEGTDQIIVMADRWVPDYVMTRQRYERFVRAIGSRYDKSLRPSLRDMHTLLTSPMLGSANTSIANYVWLPVDWEGEMPRIHWQEQWIPCLPSGE